MTTVVPALDDEAGRMRLLRRIPGIDAVAAVELDARADAVGFAAGEVLFAEGDPGDAMLVIAEGTAQLTTEGRWSTLTIATLGRGDLVGELALSCAHGRRNATLTALEPVTALVIGADAFADVIASHHDRRAAFERHVQDMLVACFVREVKPLAGLDDAGRRELATRLRPVSVPAGETILAEGQPGDGCFLLREGSAEVIVGGRQSRGLEPGDLFGEGAVIARAPRGATVRAVEDCELLELAAADLLALSSSAPQVASEITRLFRLRSAPRRADGVIAETVRSGDGEPVTILRNPSTGTFHRLGPRGRMLWDRLDGTRDLRGLTLELAAEEAGITPESTIQIAVGLARSGMLAESAVASRRLLDAGPRTRWERLLAKAGPAMNLRRDVADVDRAFGALYRAGGRFLFSAPAVAVLALVAVGGLVSFGYGVLSGTHGLERHPELAVFVLPGLALAVVIHELSHGLAVKACGRRVLGAGVGLFWLRPSVYVDTSDTWFCSRRRRAIVSLAGPFSGLVLSGLLTTASLVVGDAVLSTVLWSMSLPILLHVAINLAPFIELDGYYVLSDAVDRPNLRSDALAWLRRRIAARRTIAGDGRLFTAYAAASMAWIAGMALFFATVGRHIVEGWLTGLFGASAAVPLAWALAGLQVVLLAAAAANEWAAASPARAGAMRRLA